MQSQCSAKYFSKICSVHISYRHQSAYIYTHSAYSFSTRQNRELYFVFIVYHGFKYVYICVRENKCSPRNKKNYIKYSALPISGNHFPKITRGRQSWLAFALRRAVAVFLAKVVLLKLLYCVQYHIVLRRDISRIYDRLQLLHVLRSLWCNDRHLGRVPVPACAASIAFPYKDPALCCKIFVQRINLALILKDNIFLFWNFVDMKTLK